MIRTLLVGLTGLALAGTSRGSDGVDYNRDVRPILADHCFTCHGLDESSRKAGLRLDLKAEAMKPLKSGVTAIVPGSLDDSELIERIFADEPDRVMPPTKHGKPLSTSQKETLRRWISQGAPYRGHWAFEPPVRPRVPIVKDAKWPRNPIDAFVLARLEAEGLHPSPEASKNTLIRRVSLDLTGLPPTPVEVDAFVADKSPNAYEKVVDRLLASERYGERMAMPWLDFARYADSNGYQSDSSRDMSPWRDWVIRAFNRNLPFRSVHRRAACRRPPARGDSRPACRHRLQPQPSTDQRRRLDPGRVARRDRDRPRRDHQPDLARPDPRLCPLPRSQI